MKPLKEGVGGGILEGDVNAFAPIVDLRFYARTNERRIEQKLQDACNALGIGISIIPTFWNALQESSKLPGDVTDVCTWIKVCCGDRCSTLFGLVCLNASSCFECRCANSP